MAREQGLQVSRRVPVPRASSVDGQISLSRGSNTMRGAPVLPAAVAAGEDLDPEAAFPNGATGLSVSTVASDRVPGRATVGLADTWEEATNAMRHQQALARCLYLGSILLYSRFLFQQRSMLASPRQEWRATVARMTWEMIIAFGVVSICLFGFLASHVVRVPRALRRHLCIAMWLFTSAWMIIYTILIPSQLYRSWEWVVTSAFILINLGSTSSVPALSDAWHQERTI